MVSPFSSVVAVLLFPYGCDGSGVGDSVSPVIFLGDFALQFVCGWDMGGGLFRLLCVYVAFCCVYTRGLIPSCFQLVSVVRAWLCRRSGGPEG